MEAISKKSGKKFTGKLAALMLRIGAADPVEEAPEVTDEANTETGDEAKVDHEVAVEESINPGEPANVTAEFVPAEKPKRVYGQKVKK